MTNMNRNARMLHVNRAVGGALLVALVGVVSGCGGDDAATDLPPRLESIRPTDTPPPSSTPIPSPPLEFRAVKGEHYTISVPAGWEEETIPPRSEDGVPATLFHPTGATPSSPIRLGVVVDNQAVSGAIEQSQVLAVQKGVSEATGLTRSEVTWPGARRAVIVQWEEKQGGPQGATVRTRQLFAELNDKVIVNVVAMAPVDEFATSQLVEAMGTLRLVP